MSLVVLDESVPHVAVLKLNRPEKLNALSKDLILELTKKVQSLAAKAKEHKVRAVVIASAAAPKAFCAGADLAERSGMSEAEVGKALDSLRTLMDSVAALPCVSIAAVDGVAFGGGLELALACDLRVTSVQAKMGLSEVKLGIIPGAGGTQRLVRAVGEARAKELIFLAKILTGSEATQLGITHECVGDPLARALELAKQLCDMGPLALSAAKQAIEVGATLPMKEALDWERKCYEKTLHSKDRLEGLSAFLEKRKANYQGS